MAVIWAVYPLTGNDLKYQVIFCKSVDRVRDATWQPTCVLSWFPGRAIKSGRLRQYLVRALSTAGIQLCMDWALHFGTIFMLNWFPDGPYRSFCCCMSDAWWTQCYGNSLCQTLNYEFRSNSQFSACILYGRKNDLPREVISAPVRGY